MPRISPPIAGAGIREGNMFGRSESGVWRPSAWPGWQHGVCPACPALRDESSAALCGVRLMDAPPFLPEIWRA